MVSEFIISYDQWNLAFLISEQKETIRRTGLLEEEAIEIFEYEKNNDNLWDGAKLH